MGMAKMDSSDGTKEQIESIADSTLPGTNPVFNQDGVKYKGKILVINSDKELLDLIKYLLQTFGYETIYTRHLNEVPVILHDFNPDIILVDVTEQNVLGLLQGDPALTTTGTILMTGYDGQYPLPVWPTDASIQKPFSSEALLSVIEKVQRMKN
ncbi:MAG: hypothetical protein ABIU63_07860 [Chitinophagaceae bacterium]